MTDKTHQNDMAPVDDIASAISRLRRHYAEVVLPVWQTSGFDSSLNLPCEAVLPFHSPSTPALNAPPRFRAMACARQLYIFAEAGDKGHADRLFTALCRRFRDPEQGGVFYSVNANGQPLDTDKDLYTHAFVIFACAAYLKRFNVSAARELIVETVHVIRSRFLSDSVTGLPPAVLSADFRTVRTPPRQNPLMHLTEAYLCARDAWGHAEQDTLSSDWFDQALGELLAGIAQIFADPATGCILELPATDEASWIEPGHQFEWFYLAYGSGHPAFDASGLRQALLRAFDFAQQHGVGQKTGGVAAKLDRAGGMLDSTQRIWAQTEYLRALCCHPAPAQQARLLKQIQQYEVRFLHRLGWHEILSADDRLIREDMPSTTPYHLASSYYSLRCSQAGLSD